MTGRFALVFGNTQYGDPALAQLTAPGQDAQDLARVLQDPGLCAFDQVTVLLNEPSASAIEAIDTFFDNRKPDDLLVLYFSGHGIRDDLGALYLAFGNTVRTRLRSTALKAEYVREAMDESRSKRQVVILDCCNSGAFPAGAKAELGGAMGMAGALQGYGRYVLTASDATQFAWEGDRVIGETANSLFTHFLVKGLEGDADRDGDGSISVDDLYDYAFEQIARLTPKQTPTKSASRQEGEIILRRITRLEDIKPVSLPDDLAEAMEDSRTFVREGAVEQLAKLLNGKNLGLARSAREALEQICNADDSLRVRKAASDALAPVLAAEQQAAEQAERERLAREQAEAERLAAAKEQEEQAARQQAEAERARQKAETERLAAVKAQEQLAARQKAEADRLAQAKAEAQRLAEQKREEQRAREQAERAAMPQANLRPRWRSALWFAVALATGPLLWPLVDPPVHIGNALFGATTGLVIAFGLYREHVLRQRLSLLWITLGWSVALTAFGALISATGGDINLSILAAISGAVAGLLLALVLYRERALPAPLFILWITLAWVFLRSSEQVVFAAMGRMLTAAGSPSLIVPNLVVTSLYGALGGLATIFLIREANEPAQPAAAGQNLRPRGRAIAWIALGFIVSGGILSAASAGIGVYAAQYAVRLLAAFGLCIGLTMVLVFRVEHVDVRGWGLLGIAFGWAVGWAAAGAILSGAIYSADSSTFAWIWALGWAVGGLVTAAVLRLEGLLRGWLDVLWIALTWTLGGMIDAFISWSNSSSSVVISVAITGVITGTLGGALMIGLMRRARGKS